jgi:hypothetical protein
MMHDVKEDVVQAEKIVNELITTDKTLVQWEKNLKNDSYVFRVNCLDCLDRTNMAQFLVYLYRIDYSGGDGSRSRIEEISRSLWNNNANYISLIYTGTNSTTFGQTLKNQEQSSGGLFSNFISKITENKVVTGLKRYV